LLGGWWWAEGWGRGWVNHSLQLTLISSKPFFSTKTSDWHDAELEYIYIYIYITELQQKGNPKQMRRLGYEFLPNLESFKYLFVQEQQINRTSVYPLSSISKWKTIRVSYLAGYPIGFLTLTV